MINRRSKLLIQNVTAFMKVWKTQNKIQLLINKQLENI